MIYFHVEICMILSRALNVSCIHKGTGKPDQVGLDKRCVTILFDDVTQFTGLSRLLPLYYLWLQTPPRSSCFCYYQHDWATQQLLHFPIRKLGSTRRSIATHPRHPSHPSVRPKISVSAVTRRLFKKKPFTNNHQSLQPSPLHHHYYYQPQSTGNLSRQYNPRPTSLDITTFQHHLMLPASAQQ